MTDHDWDAVEPGLFVCLRCGEVEFDWFEWDDGWHDYSEWADMETGG